MRTLMVLILVLCLASVAGAYTSYQISVNGEKEPVDSEITIGVGEHLTLDIWADSGIEPCAGKPWMLVCNTDMGDISGGVPLHESTSVMGPTEDNEYVIPPDGQEGVWGFVFISCWGDPIPPGTVLADSFDFHCLGEGDTVISLYEVFEGVGVAQLFDQVIIHQVSSDCLVDEGDQEYDDWVDWGKPECWCYCRQCRGDADGRMEFGLFSVLYDDVAIVAAAIALDDTALALVENGICADFDHRKEYGRFRVLYNDVGIIAHYVSSIDILSCDQPDPNNPNPVYPGAVYTGPYNFWCDPVNGCPGVCP